MIKILKWLFSFGMVEYKIPQGKPALKKRAWETDDTGPK